MRTTSLILLHVHVNVHNLKL